MNNRDLIKKLGNLREIKPNEEWLKSNRDTLFSQISNSGAANLTSWSSFVINVKSFARTVSMPAMALGSIMLVVLTSSIFSHSLFTKTKPNESLYIARVISEKAKLYTILDTEVREKKAVEFAINHVQDISNVLATPDFKDEKDIAKLNASFQTEIKVVKDNIARLEKAPIDNGDVVSSSGVVVSEDVFTATALKDDQGLSLEADPIISNTDIATSTEINSSTKKIIETASELFEQKKYTEASQALEMIK